MKIFSLVAWMLVDGALEGARANYPSRPITLVAPTTAGGPPDTIGRIIGERMKKPLGQPVIVENVTGAGGSLGVQRVAHIGARRLPVSIWSIEPHVFTGAVYILYVRSAEGPGASAMPLTSAPMVFVARESFAPNSVKEVVAWMKEHPKGATLRFVGLGRPGQGLGHGLPEQDRYRISVRALSRRLCDHPGPDRWTDRSGLPRGLQHRGASSKWQERLTPFCRPPAVRWRQRIPSIDGSRRAGFPRRRSGTASGCRAARRADAIAKLTPRRVDVAGRSDGAATARADRAGASCRASSRRRRLKATHHTAEIEKWWPIINGGGRQGG